jgi:Abortive infection C-terminus
MPTGAALSVRPSHPLWGILKVVTVHRATRSYPTHFSHLMPTVHTVWSKALSRRNQDPERAITVARTLLGAVCMRILDDIPVTYSDKEDLPKLYSMAAKVLNLAPHQHSEEPIKAILGGAMKLVNGPGTFRNRLSDSHGQGGKPVRPSPRRASLAVNTAGAIATFLVETHLEKKPKP